MPSTMLGAALDKSVLISRIDKAPESKRKTLTREGEGKIITFLLLLLIIG